jgi:hypothetical protein
MRARLAVGTLLTCLALPNLAQGHEFVYGGKLPLTRGVSQLEGAGGGGLANWALITGNETEDGIGGSAFATHLDLPNYQFDAVGGSVGLFDRVELSYAHQWFDTGHTGALLGLGQGFTFEQDIVGAKLRLTGDAIYDQDRWMPQIAVGVQLKHNNQSAIVHAVGARHADGVDFYASATKVMLAHSLLLNATVRYTDANQFGLLGFGGDREHGRTLQLESSIGYMVTDRLLVGAEYRTRPDNLGFAREDDAFDAYAALALTHNVTLTAAYVDLGSVATFRDQHGLYLSLQAGF